MAEKIRVATDGSDTGSRAVDAAAKHSTKLGLDWCILHGLMLGRAIELGARKVSTRSCVGEYADQILDVAETEKPTVIVLGSRSLGRMRGALLGSVSQ